MQTIEVPPDARPCRNCGKPLLGEHCYACGQPVKGLVRQFSSIVGDFLDSVFEWDSRTVRTLGPLMLRPGYLTLEYFEGRRVRYVSPVRLFVFLCIVSFFVLTFFVDTDIPTNTNEGPFDRVTHVDELEREHAARTQRLVEERDALTDERRRDRFDARIARLQGEADRHREWLRLRDEAIAAGVPPPPLPSTEANRTTFRFNDRDWDAESNPLTFDSLPDGVNRWINTVIGRAYDNAQRVERNPGALVESFLQTLPTTFFVLLPLFALLLKIFYVFRRRLYMEHLIVALHSHAFLCMTLLIVLALGGLRSLAADTVLATALGWVAGLLIAWVPIYLWLMQKRVYGQGVIMTTLKYMVIGFLYLMLLSFGATVTLMTNLVTM